MGGTQAGTCSWARPDSTVRERPCCRKIIDQFDFDYEFRNVDTESIGSDTTIIRFCGCKVGSGTTKMAPWRTAMPGGDVAVGTAAALVE